MKGKWAIFVQIGITMTNLNKIKVVVLGSARVGKSGKSRMVYSHTSIYLLIKHT